MPKVLLELKMKSIYAFNISFLYESGNILKCLIVLVTYIRFVSLKSFVLKYLEALLNKN